MRNKNVLWGEVEELFCETCGESLYDEFIFHKYDLNTGEKLFQCKSFCKNKRWYNRHSSMFRFLGKDKIIFREKKEKQNVIRD